jgi:UDP-N-acetylglucosamine acyltransferase
MIHPTAIIHPQAKLHSSVQVGPYAVIDAGVELGADCIVGPHAYLTGITKAGAGNKFHACSVIGGTPQDLKYKGEATCLNIGDRNTFREHVTINCATTPEEATVIGSDNLLMAGVHIGHNSVIGNRVIMANTSMLGGHAIVEDRALLSGSCLVHQFCRVGTLAVMQGGSAISKDLAPFTVVRGVNCLSGLNVIGLRRAGFSSEERVELRALYHALFRSGTPITVAAAEAREKFSSRSARLMLDFIATSKRGVCAMRGGGRGDQEETEE